MILAREASSSAIRMASTSRSTRSSSAAWRSVMSKMMPSSHSAPLRSMVLTPRSSTQRMPPSACTIRYSRTNGRCAAIAALISRSTVSRSSGCVTATIVCFDASTKSEAGYPVMLSISSLTRWTFQMLVGRSPVDRARDVLHQRAQQALGVEAPAGGAGHGPTLSGRAAMHPIRGLVRIHPRAQHRAVTPRSEGVSMFRPLALLGTVAVLAAGVAACGDDEQSDSTPSKTTPAPVAQIDALTGRSTDVQLDKGFVTALGTLKLTPAPGRRPRRSRKAGVARFPITGGNVTYYKPGSVAPYVQGEIDHSGSGLA